jgi:hypothetical protein
MMTYEKIKELLDKYFEGETSLEDEKILRGYFSSPNMVDKRLKAYAPLFQFFDVEATIQMSKNPLEKEHPQGTSAIGGDRHDLSSNPAEAPIQKPQMRAVYTQPTWRKTLSWAAAIALLVVSSVFIFKQFDSDKKPVAKAKIIIFDENSDPEKALEELEKALNKTARKLKKGTDETAKSLQTVKDATRILNEE